MTLRDTAKRIATRLGLVEPPPPGSEKGADYYDDAYSESEEYKLPYHESRYYFAWTVIVDRVRRSKTKHVLEIGCGPGQLAEFLADQGLESYVGFDFSPVAIRLAKEKGLPRCRFEVDDARSTPLYESCAGALVICTEVLEHVEEDETILSRIPVGTRCLCTVPNFPYESHVRHFETTAEVEARYARFFEQFDVVMFKRPDSPTGRYFLFDGVRR